MGEIMHSFALNGLPKYQCSPVICWDHKCDSRPDKKSDLIFESDCIYVEGCQSDDPPAYEENLEDSGYGEITINIEPCSEDTALSNREPSSSPRKHPQCLLEPDEDLLIEALTTSLDATFSMVGVANLTGSVQTPDFHAIAHGGFSDIHYGEWECSTDGEAGRRKFIIHPVAVKVLRVLTRQDLNSGRLRKRLDHEVNIWHRLSHPNIAKFFGTTYHIGGRPAMVMAWYENGSAVSYLKSKKPDADRLALVLDVANGLKYLHTMKPPIVHGDLKANNVLITDDHHAVVSDFGLSKVIDELVTSTGNVTSTQGGCVRWQAPELIVVGNAEFDDQLTPARSVTRVSDIWSFGCTSYELLTSKLPYGHRWQDCWVILDVMNSVKPAGSDDLPVDALHDDIWGILDNCWTFSPQARPSILDLVDRLCHLRPTT